MPLETDAQTLTNAGVMPLSRLLVKPSDELTTAFNVTGFVLRFPAEIWENS